MLNYSLLQNLLLISVACSVVTVIFIQKTKKYLPNSKIITVYSFIINMIIGYFFSKTFSNIDYIKALWVGLFSFLGADNIYKTLEGKLAPYTELIKNNGISDIKGEITYE